MRIYIIPDDKYIEQSNKRLKKIAQLEQKAATMCRADKTDANRLSELKASENQFNAELKKRKSRNEMENSFKQLKINHKQLNSNNQLK